MGGKYQKLSHIFQSIVWSYHKKLLSLQSCCVKNINDSEHTLETKGNRQGKSPTASDFSEENKKALFHETKRKTLFENILSILGIILVKKCTINLKQ